MNDAERHGVRCAVNVEICLVHHSLEEILAQLDPARWEEGYSLSAFWAAWDVHTFQQMRVLPCFANQTVKAVGYLMQLLLGRSVLLSYLESLHIT